MWQKTIVQAVVLFFIFIPFGNCTIAAGQTTDLIIADNDFVELHNYFQDGNVFVKEFGTLLISNGTFKVLQDYDYQYKMVVEDFGTVLISNATFTTDFKFSLSLYDNATLQVVNSNINFEGFLNASCKEMILYRTTVAVDYITISAADATITDSELISQSNITFISTPLTIRSAKARYGIIMTGTTNATLVDVVTVEIRCYSTAVARIYRVVGAIVTDSIGMPIKSVHVDFLNPVTHTIVESAITNKLGEASVELLSDIIDVTTYPNSQYVGNYIVRATHLEQILEKDLTLPYYRYNVTPAITPIELRFEFTEFIQAVWELYERTERDLVIASNDTKVIKNTISGRYIHSGNLWLKENGKLIVEDTELFLEQPTDYEFCILIENNAALVLQNAVLKSNHKFTVYIFGNATFELNGCEAIVEIIYAHGNAQFDIENSKLICSRIDLNVKQMKFTTADVETGFCDLAAIKIEIKDTILNATVFKLSTETLTVFNSTFSQPLQIFKGTAKLINIKVSEVVIGKDAIVQEGWLAFLNVVNGFNRPLAQAEIMVAQITEGLREEIVATARTDFYGRATIPLIARIHTYKKSFFIGNYKFVAYFFKNKVRYESEKQVVAMDTNKNITLKFKEALVPPFTVTPVVMIAPNVTKPNETVSIAGEVLYNEGPERVAGAEVRITIIETGEHWFLTTDSYGRFNLTFNAPLAEGEYTVGIAVYDRLTTLNSSVTVKLKVVVEAKGLFEWNIILIPIAIGCAAAIVYLGIMYLKKRTLLARPVISEETKKRAAIRWFVRSIRGRER